MNINIDAICFFGLIFFGAILAIMINNMWAYPVGIGIGWLLHALFEPTDIEDE